MESGGNMFSGFSSRSRGQQNGDSPSLPWYIWELSTTNNNSSNRFVWDNGNGSSNGNIYNNTTCSMQPQEEDASTKVVFGQNGGCLYRYNEGYQGQQSVNVGDGSNLHPDPHLTCLKLGKRHYFEDSSSIQMSDRYFGGVGGGGLSLGKRGKPYDGASSSTVASGGSPAIFPRCQVEGCHVALNDAKDYHKRHKVCEMHSKAPLVMVLGLEQRFCQQCSRFHVVSEFDDSKRSCRRRLAGHNERRRKSSQDSIPRNSSQDKSPRGRALSLLSSKADSWVDPSDISSRSSAALRELIAEHRAAILARQLILERHLNHHHQQHQAAVEGLTESQTNANWFASYQYQGQVVIEPNCWNRFHEANRHVTLDLMQTPSSAFGLLPSRMKNKEEADDDDEEDEEEEWNTFE